MARRVGDIAALQRDLTGESGQRLADGGCLLVGVARRLDAGAGERELHQRGAVETDAAAPAPVIGGAEELQRGGDEVGRGRGDRLQVLAIESAAAGEPAIGAFRSEEQTTELQSLMRISYAVNGWK